MLQTTISKHAGCRMKLPILVIIIIITSFLPCALSADNENTPLVEVDDVMVSGSRMPDPFLPTARSVTVIGREEIEKLPAAAIPDLLETVGGVDVRQRGGFGMQADVAIRGSSFEQTLILVDGINASDAQTGHHNMNLPVNISDIERIEIIKGPGSGIYGHHAMGGVINIITKDPARPRVSGAIHAGQNDYYRAAGGLQGNIGPVSNRISLSKRSSSGHIENEATDFESQTLFYKGMVRRDDQEITVGMGYTKNDFGAYKFYSDVYPDQRENTETFFTYLNADIPLRNITLSPDLFWRRNKDTFDLAIDGNLFRNEHRTNTYGVVVDSRFDSILGTTVFGGEAAAEGLNSSSLGDHDRNRFGFFLEHRFSPVRCMSLGAGASAVKYSNRGWEDRTGADVTVEWGEGFTLFASAAESLRVPTFTELYYSTPANVGNPDLEPERAWTYEIGFRRMADGFGMNAGVFYREGENIIDWVRAPEDTTWRVMNIAGLNTRGFELGIDLYPGILFNRFHPINFNLNYTFLDTTRETGPYESKYALDHLRHQVKGSLFVHWSNRLSQSIAGRYGKRMNGDTHVVADTRVTFSTRRWNIFLDIANMFDATYVDAGFAHAPGRWAVLGIDMNWDLQHTDISAIPADARIVLH
ncbi:MAG: TonB-dependent receptor [Desulfobacterales bacterium]